VHHGAVTYKAVAEALGYEHVAPQEALKPWWQHPED
jgi:alanine dehydrogenase